jgi:hypothetical protein
VCVWNSIAKPHLTINIHINNEGQKGKMGHVWGWVSVGGERINREGEGGQIRLMYFVYMYEDRTVKPIEIVLRRGWQEMKENDGVGESN